MSMTISVRLLGLRFKLKLNKISIKDEAVEMEGTLVAKILSL